MQWGAELDSLVLYIATTTLYLAIYGVPFVCLAYFFPSNPQQSLFRRDITTDVIYYYFTGIYTFANIYLITFFQSVFYPANTIINLKKEGLPPLMNLPIFVQIIILFLLVDFIQYWLHRLFHKVDLLWKLHAVHHSSQTLDWLSAMRWHPLNHIFYTMLILSLIYAFGFKPEALAIYMGLYSLNAFVVHANLKWTYGPLRYVFASPVFHRWHHTSMEEGGNKNFAPYISFFDFIFGTFYMPKDIQPMNFGIKEPLSNNFLGQLLLKRNRS